MAIKILIGGSPCTYWSIAQKNNRETEASGMGWELFKNYLIAKEKFKPDFFLYENNKSAAQSIKDQIAEELGVGIDPEVRFTHINSALVSAQNRQRFYVTNFGDIEQPDDRGILLRDILETGADAIGLGYRGRTEDGKWKKRFESNGESKSNALTTAQTDSMVAEPLYVGEVPGHPGTYRNGKQPSQQYRVYSPDSKAVAVTTCAITNVAQTVRIGTLPRSDGEMIDHQQSRIYSIDAKSTNLNANGGGQGAKTGLYAVPASLGNSSLPVYEVRDGIITIKDKQYPIKLSDGFYIIRKLTPVECERLQTLPDGYTKAVSNAQRYKGLGNGWTAEIIIWLLNHALKDVPKDEEIVVLSMYDGIATGRYCLDKMGFTNVKYHAYEIDKYPIQVAMDNYPDIIQHGDAFAVREDDWKPPQTRSEWLDELLGGDS